MKDLRRDSRAFSVGFSLVEIVITIGIISFCLTALLGLMSAGLFSQRESREETVAAGIAVNILEDLRAGESGTNTARFQLSLPGHGQPPAVTGEQIFFDRNGELAAQPGDRFFALELKISPPELPVQPHQASIELTWPAQAAPTVRSGAFVTVDAFFLD